jgi:hypothetical protein
MPEFQSFIARKPVLVEVSANQVVSAKQHVQRAIEAGSQGTDTDLTASGVLLHVLMDLGVVLDINQPNESE